MALTASASKAGSIPFKAVLKDGQEVTLRVVGDERLNFYVTTEGKIVFKENGTYRFATMFEVQSLKSQSEQLEEETRAKASLFPSVLSAGNATIEGSRLFPHMGRPKVLVLMVEFSDCTFTYSREDVEKLFNSTEYNSDSYRSYGSMAQYFDDCSNGQFRPQFDIYGTFKLDRSYAYYGKGANDNCREFIPDACEAAMTEGVDFSEYDLDNDGYVDLVYILYAGFDASNGDDEDLLWSKSGYMSFPGTYNGKKLYRYSISSELFGFPGIENIWNLPKPPLCGIGIMVHEFSHSLGLTDFYPTLTWLDANDNTRLDIAKYDNQSMEEWDIMDNGENVNYTYDPTPYSAWERELMGWTNEIPKLTERCDITLTPLKDGGTGLRIFNDNDATGNEYWILENIPSGDNAGWYRGMPASGMLITHINYKSDKFNNYAFPNNEPGAPRITVVPADGTLLTSYRELLSPNDPDYLTARQYRENEKGDVYPCFQNGLNVTSFSDYKAYTGVVNKPITDIVMLPDGTVAFKFMGGVFIFGDVNNDGQVTMADANAVVNYTLGISTDSFDEEAADLNGDGNITVADANVIVNICMSE